LGSLVVLYWLCFWLFTFCEN